MSVLGAIKARGRWLTYFALTAGLLAASFPLTHLSWIGSAWIHTLLESIATLLAFVIGAIAVVRYYAHKTAAYLLLGAAFLAAGLSDTFHAVVTSPSCSHCDAPSMLGLVSWSGYISGLFLSSLFSARLPFWRFEHSLRALTGRREKMLFAGMGVGILGTFVFFRFAPLALHRPAELAAGILYAVAAAGHWWKRAWKRVSFEHWLMLFLITSAIAQLVYLPWSVQNFDSIECVAHILRIIAYCFLLAGLLSSLLTIFRGAERALHDQKRVSESLAREVATRQRTEAALEAAQRKLEARVAENTEELAEQDQLADLGAKIAVALTQPGDLNITLQRSAEIISRSIEASTIRIWTLNAEGLLELAAGAGEHDDLKGYEKIRLGQFHVGRVAEAGKPYLTNAVQEDPLVGDKEWMRRHGIVAMACQPLMLEERVEGVLSAISGKPLKDTAMQALGSIAGSLGLFISRRRAESARRESEERVRLLLDSTAESIFGIDLEGNCTFANRTGLRVLGYDQQAEVLGRNLHALTHHTRLDGTEYPAAECPIVRAVVQGDVCHVDTEALWRRDGTCVPAEYWAYPVVKSGEVVGGVITFLDLTARKKAEEEQRILVSLVETSRDFIGMASPDRKVMYLNSGAAEMIGLDAREAVGMDISAFLTRDSWKQLKSRLPILFETGRLQCESQLVHFKTGAVIDALVDSFILRKPDTGEIFRLAAVIRDVTEQKRSEEALRTSEERFRIAAENASDQVFDLDLRTGMTEVFGRNPRIGDRPAPLTFDGWKDLVHPDDLPALLDAIAHHIQSGERYAGEYRVLGEQGDVYHYSLRAQAIRNAQGRPVRWVGLANDITEQRKSAQAIAQLAAIVQSSDDAIIGSGLDGIIITWNAGAERLTGYTAAEALNTPVAIMLVQPEVALQIRECCLGGEVSRSDQVFFRCKSGDALPVSLTVSPIRSSSGEITGLAAIARDMSAQVKVEVELAHQARHDHLTGLPNRAMLADRLEASIARAAASGLMAAVIYLDLDGFKLVNDTLGHEFGDVLLQQVTERLRTCVREPDTLARMGGDEFMVVVNELREDKLALAIADRLSDVLRDPYRVAGRELYLTASIGISMYPRDGKDVSMLRRNADAAMYQAKRSGKDRVLFFTPRMRDSFLERLELETDLRHALDNSEFLLYFQPIFSAAQSRQTAFEALVRWRHPTRGLISPDKFIPVTEETGLIVRLGAWVLGAACRACRIWQDAGLDSVRVAVNVSPLEFTRTNFAEGVLDCLDEAGLDGTLLELEVTEGILMRDLEGSIRKMSRLRQRGVRISIDDFGTGYSSLGYLPRLPVDTLKIDRSFVAQLGTNSAAHSLIEGMISLAHSIGKRVIVEGVETQWQLTTLRELGADEIQGFLLGRPAPLPDWSAAPRAASGLVANGQLSALLENVTS